VILTIPNCSKKDEEFPVTEKKKAFLYTSVPINIIESIKLEFEKENPQSEIEVFRAGTGETMNRIYQEAEAGKVRADIIWLADFSAAEELKEEGLLQKYSSPEAENIIPIFVDTEGYYTGSRLLNMVVAYNRKFIKKRPGSYRDLLNPKWKGKVGIANPETSGSSFFTVATLFQRKDFDWEYFMKLYLNRCEIADNNITLIKKIAEGELYMGITIDFEVRKLLMVSPSLPIEYVFPKDGIVAVASPIAISRDCRSIETSKVFIDWVLSKKGQGFISKKMGIVPLRTDVDMPEGMIPLRQIKIIPSNVNMIYKNKKNIIRIFKDIFSGKSLEKIKM
jgi:iron(III) transport system substrate-binding protein